MKSLESKAIELLKAPTCEDSNLYISPLQSSEDESEHSSDEEY